MGPVAGTGRLVAGLFGLAVFSPGVKITGVKRTGLFTFEVTVEGQTTPLTVKAVGETMAALFARAGASQRH